MFLRLLSALTLAAFLAPELFAQLELPPSISRSSWTTVDGLPQNSVSGMSQDAAGYLWIATYGGLARFDGRHFETFDVLRREDLPGNRFRRIIVDPDGALWVWLQEFGLFHYRDDRFTPLETPTDLRQFAADGEGRIWGVFARGVFRIFEAGTELVRAGAFRAILAEEDGVLWVSAQTGELLRLANGEEAVFGPETGLPAYAARSLLIRDGILWGGGRDGVWRSTDATKTEFEPVEGAPQAVNAMVLDERGALWFGCTDRLVRWGPDTGTATEAAQGNFVSFLADGRGNLWAGSLGGGLHCLRYAVLHDLTAPLGLPAQDAWVITENPSGTVFLLFDRILFEVRGNDVVSREYDDNLRSALVDRNGDLWVGMAGGLHRIRGEDDVMYGRGAGLTGSVRALLQGRDGSLRVGTSVGLFRQEGERFVRLFPRELGTIFFLLEDSASGILWAGTQEGLARIEGDSFTCITAKDGLSPGAVRALHLDRDGVLWAGTYGGGLSRLEHGQITRYSRANGLVDNFLSCILEDDEERFWINSNIGPFVIHRHELNRLASGETDRVACTSFTPGEGAQEANGGSQPAGWRTADGRMWFPTIAGVTVADPNELPLDEPSPAVRIESLELGESRELDVRFAALGFTSPERVRIQYRLQGHHGDWLECDGERRANYSYLPPGEYEFEVRARNGYGPWSPVVSRSLVVEPRFHETNAFLVSIAVIAALAALGLTEFRLRRSRERTAELVRLIEERERAERSLSRSRSALRRLSRELLANQETERRRISRELHDDVTQRLAALAIQAELLETRLDTSPAQARGQLREIVEKAQQLAGDVQQLSRRLHPVGLRTLGLAEAVRQECDAFARRSGAEIELDEDVASDEIVENVAVAAFRILQESLQNIEKHARAGAVSISVRMEGDELVLTVSDHGSGFDLEAGADVGLGLITMRERAASIGGKLSIASKPGEGTTVRLCAPGGRKA